MKPEFYQNRKTGRIIAVIDTFIENGVLMASYQFIRPNAPVITMLMSRLLGVDNPDYVKLIEAPQVEVKAQAQFDVCQIPPAGWQCSRIAGHVGPCAASRTPNAKVYNLEVAGYPEDLVVFPIEPGTARLARFGTNLNYPPLLFFGCKVKGKDNKLMLRVEDDPFPVGYGGQMVVFRGWQGRLQCYELGNNITVSEAYEQGKQLNQPHLLTIEDAQAIQRLDNAIEAYKVVGATETTGVIVQLGDLITMERLINKALNIGIKMPTHEEVERSNTVAPVQRNNP